MTRISLLLALCLSAPAQTVFRLSPVDDTARDPAFRSYVKKLRSATEARNTSALRKLVDNEVVVGPAKDDSGWAAFVAKWRPGEEDSKLWPALSDMLSLGFIREHPRLFLSPYLVWRFPRELNPATHLVVIRSGVELRVAPSARAPVAGLVSFEIVEQLGRPDSAEGLGQWILVRTVAGQKGYLSTRDVMSPLMPHAQFGISHGKWMLIALED